MLNRILLFVTLSIATIGAGAGAFNFYNQPKIAYVRSQDLVEKYAGTKEGMKSLEGQKQTWRANIDTLSLNLQRSIDKYNKESASFSTSKKGETEKNINAQRTELIDYSNAIEEKSRNEEEKVMQGILNQINSYVSDYGKRNAYDIILGTTVSGNLLYGNDYLDVTDDILKGLNESYSGKK